MNRSARELAETERQRVLDALQKLARKRWISTSRRRELMAPLVADFEKYDDYLMALRDAEHIRRYVGRAIGSPTRRGGGVEEDDLPLLAPIPENPAVIVTPIAQEEGVTTLSSLFIVCSHGRRSAHTHSEVEVGVIGWCPGGRPATLEDLGGEKVWWCKWGATVYCPQDEKDHSSCGERILIPLPQMVAGESL